MGGSRSVGAHCEVPCCIAGCGPAGAVPAYLLARVAEGRVRRKREA
jgi:hypothetical protein